MKAPYITVKIQVDTTQFRKAMKKVARAARKYYWTPPLRPRRPLIHKGGKP